MFGFCPARLLHSGRMTEIELPGLRGLSRDGETLFFRGVPVKEMLAYPIALAAVLIGKSYWTLRREVHLGPLASSLRGRDRCAR